MKSCVQGLKEISYKSNVLVIEFRQEEIIRKAGEQLWQLNLKKFGF